MAGGIPIAGWLRKSDSKMDYFADMCATLKRLDLDLSSYSFVQCYQHLLQFFQSAQLKPFTKYKWL